MNAVALRAEQAVADYLGGAVWPSDGFVLLESGDNLLIESGSSIIYGIGLGAPSVLTSFSHGEFEDEDEQDTMPVFPRIVVMSTNAAPVQRFDITCEVGMTCEMQVSADDTTTVELMEIMHRFDSLLADLLADSPGPSVLDATADNEFGPFTAQFCTPLDFGQSSVQNRSRTFQRSFTIFCSATT